MANMKTVWVRAMCASAVLLQACGGGGGGDSAGSPAPVSGTQPGSIDAGGIQPTEPGAPTPAAQHSIGTLLQSGLYAVSYGSGFIGGKEDKSIWRTTLRTWPDGTQEPVITPYAGNDQGGDDLLDPMTLPVYEPDGNNPPTSIQMRLDAAHTKFLYGQGTNPFVAHYSWNVEVETIELAQTSIQEFVSETFSARSDPIPGLALSGNFPAESLGYLLHYSADVDQVVLDEDPLHLTNTQATFEGSSYCSETVTEGKRIAYRILPGGSMNIYEIDTQMPCSQATTAGTLIGVGNWVRKQGNGFEYIEKNFPPNISYARADAKFMASDYAAGIRAVNLISPQGIWSAGYLVPAGVKLRFTDMGLNKTAADAVKAIAPM